MWLSALSRVPKRSPTYSRNWSLLRASISTTSSQYSRLFAIAEQLRSNTDGLPPLANILRSGSASETLAEAGLSEADQAWLQELPSRDFVGSLKLLNGRFADLKRVGNADLGHDLTTPAWLATHMLYHGAQLDEDIKKAAALVEQYASIVPPPHSHAIAILTIARLADLQFTSAIRGLIWTFCNSSPLPSQFHCNLLLMALSLHTECGETTLLVTSVLRFMARHELKVSEETYDALLHPRITSLPIVRAIEQKMAHEKVLPTMRQLRALFRLMTKRRIHSSAHKYLMEMRKRQTKKQGDETPVELDPKIRARYVQSLTRPSSAIRMLQRLLPQAEETQSPLRFRTEKPTGDWGLRGNDWTALLTVAARSKDVSAEALLAAFREAVAGHPGNVAAYAVVIRGLLCKRDFAGAITVWDIVRSSSGIRVNTIALGIGVSALTAGGQPHRAFTLLEEIRIADYEWGSQICPGRSPPQVNITAVNRFMIALTRYGRPDATFALWDHMQTLYGLSPDAHTFNILLGTARWSRKFDDTIIGQLAHLGLTGPSPIPEDATLDERGRAVAHMNALLDPTHRARVTGLWHGAPASRVALRLAVEFFLGHWPFLRDVLPPTRALRRSRDDAAHSPMSDALNSVMALGGASADHEPSPLLALVPSDYSAFPFPHVMPTDVSFRALIDLLAAEGLHTEIPLVLGWQRALRIAPSKATLATALVYWMDVSMDAPLVERFKRTRGRDPFALLSAWMEDWVGKTGMPGPKMMSHEMRRKAYYTDSRYLDIIDERNWKVQRAIDELEMPL